MFFVLLMSAFSCVESNTSMLSRDHLHSLYDSLCRTKNGCMLCGYCSLSFLSFLRNRHTHSKGEIKRKKKIVAEFKFEHFQQALNSSQFRVCVPYNPFFYLVLFISLFFCFLLSCVSLSPLLPPSYAPRNGAAVMNIALLCVAAVSWHSQAADRSSAR